MPIAEVTERRQSTKPLVISFSQHLVFSLDQPVTKHQILHIKYPPKILSIWEKKRQPGFFKCHDNKKLQLTYLVFSILFLVTDWSNENSTSLLYQSQSQTALPVPNQLRKFDWKIEESSGTFIKPLFNRWSQWTSRLLFQGKLFE